MPGEATEVGSIIGYLVLNRADWLAGVAATERDAEKLGRLNPDIRIQTNAGVVIAQLALVDTATKRIAQSSTAAQAPVIGLWGALAALAPAAVPIAGVLTGAFIGAVPAAAALALGIFGISSELKSGHLAGTQYGRDIHTLQGDLSRLKQTAAGNLLPGIDRAIQTSHPLFVLVNQDVGVMATQLGHIIASVGPAFLTIFTDLNPLFVTFGNLISRGADSLAHWTQNTDGVTGFVTYVQAELPHVLQFLGELIVLIAHIVQAAAPMGGVILGGLGVLVRLLDALPISVLQVLVPLLIGAYSAFKTYAGITFLVALVNTALERHAVIALAAGQAVAVAEAEKAEAAAASARARLALVAGINTAMAEEAAAAVASAEIQAAAAGAAATAATTAAAEVSAAGDAAAAGWASMLGPIGALAVGIGILSFGLLGNTHNAQDAAKAMNTYADSVKASTNTLDDANLAQTRKNLSDQKAFSLLDDLEHRNNTLGLTYKDLALAVNGTDEQYKRVHDTLESMVGLDAMSKSGLSPKDAFAQSAAAQKLADTLTTMRSGLNQAVTSQKQLSSAEMQTTNAHEAQLRAAAALYHLHGTTGVNAYLAARDAAKQNEAQVRTQTLAFQMENDAASILAGTLDRLNGKKLSAADALNAFQSSMVNFSSGATPGTGGGGTSAERQKIALDALAIAQQRYNAAVKAGDSSKVAAAHLALERAQLAVTNANNAAAKSGGTAAGTIKGMDAASVQLRGELNNQVHLLEQLVEADGGWQNSTAKSRDEMKQLRQQVIDNAVAHGVDRTAVTQYVDSLFKIPNKIPPTKLDIDTAQAQAKIAALKRYIKLTLSSVRINAVIAARVTVEGGGSGRGTSLVEGATAGGGTVMGAGGPKSDSVYAQLPNGNMWRVSPGEEVIQNPYSSMYRPLLKAINNGQLKLGTFSGGRAGGEGHHTHVTVQGPLLEQTVHNPLDETASASGLVGLQRARDQIGGLFG